MRHFGTEALFCLHPDDDSNRPADLVQRYWAIYPQFLRDLFVHAFVTGLQQPDSRVTEGQWIKGMDRLRDGMVSCAVCGTTNFWDAGEPGRTCRTCQASLQPPLVIQVGRRTVAVNTLTTLRSDHFETGVDNPLTLGRMRRHPTEAERWGLVNVSGFPWSVSYPDGQLFVLEPERTTELVDGARLQIGSSDAVVRRLR
jgi:hypothetical protein